MTSLSADEPSDTSVDRGSESRSVIAVWAFLSVITLVSWQLSPGSRDATSAVGDGLVAGFVALGAIKTTLIIRYFMEVRFAPRWLTVVTTTWVGLVWSTLLGVYLYR